MVNGPKRIQVMNQLKQVATQVVQEFSATKKEAFANRLSTLLEYFERNPDPDPAVILQKIRNMDKPGA